MAPKMLLFAGPPASSSVDATSCTLSQFEDTFKSFIDGPHTRHAPQHALSDEPTTLVVWRSLPLIKQPLHTGFSQAHHVAHISADISADFFTTAHIATLDGATKSFDEAQDLLSQFCEQSLAAHEPLDPSQSRDDSLAHNQTETESSLQDTSFLTTSSKSANHPPPQPLPIPCHLSDLEDIPTAPRVTGLAPQTITVNLIAGVISIAQPRTVTTRWGKQIALVEVLVGDETKSGFGITFWLSSGSVPHSQLSQIRRQDILLMRNVGLNVFRNKVYGQSLTRGLTQISLLWRKDGGGHYTTRNLSRAHPSAHPQLIKTKKVKDWVIHFVGGERPAVRRAGKSRKSWDQPPDDTQ